MARYILALDQGTTSSRAVAVDRQGHIKGMAQCEFEQVFPRPGWVEHQPQALWASQVGVARQVMGSLGLTAADIAAIGITNQRETTLVWDRATGQPLHNAIVWQDRRTSDTCQGLRADGVEPMIRERTGLLADAYFSGTKVKWILDHVEGARQRAARGELAFGTVDSWLVWQLTRGQSHTTDLSNASRTMLLNIHTREWDPELLRLLEIPMGLMPSIAPSSGVCGHTHPSIFGQPIPIAGIAGDQQAALFGQLCVAPGMVKCTYGTGGFLLMNTGQTPFPSRHNLLTTIAWGIGGRVDYALEGSVFVAGAAVQWLRDGLGLIDSSAQVEALAAQVPHTDGVYFVPALTGLGAPHWDPHARGLIIGITRGTTRGHLARAALEGIAFQTADVLAAMQADSGAQPPELRVDGGAAANNLLIQFQSDILGIPAIRPQSLESTALGAAFLAGLAVGFWGGVDELQGLWQPQQTFTPRMDRASAQGLIAQWAHAVGRAKGWAPGE